MSAEFNRAYLESLLEEREPGEIRAEFAEQLMAHPECEQFLQLFESMDDRLASLVLGQAPEVMSAASAGAIADNSWAPAAAPAAAAAGPVRLPQAPKPVRTRRPFFWWAATAAAVLVLGILFVERSALQQAVPNPPVAMEESQASAPAERALPASETQNPALPEPQAKDDDRLEKNREQENLLEKEAKPTSPQSFEDKSKDESRSESVPTRKKVAAPQPSPVSESPVAQTEISQQDRAVMDQSLYGKVPQPPGSAQSGLAQPEPITQTADSGQTLDQAAEMGENVVETARSEKVTSEPYFRPEMSNTFVPQELPTADSEVQGQVLAWARNFFRAWSTGKSVRSLFVDQPAIVLDKRLGFEERVNLNALERRRPISFTLLAGNQVRLSFVPAKGQVEPASDESTTYTFFVSLDKKNTATELQILFLGDKP
ncbi:MAG: hypothetical protein H6510_01930 [Acidobacteria bacterium]|nr:hypothetical protein [Acidobacteriota bacterium]